jgi:hypothetical protein
LLFYFICWKKQTKKTKIVHNSNKILTKEKHKIKN